MSSFIAPRTVIDGGEHRLQRRRVPQPMIVIGVIVLATLVARRPGYKLGGNVVVRCRKGHLFTTIWIPGVKLKALDLGFARLQHCPVGNHRSEERRVGKEGRCRWSSYYYTYRRRHTRCLSDWSSDVCSSDLTIWIPGVKLKALDLGFARLQHCPVGNH